MDIFQHSNHRGHCVIAGEAKCGTSSMYRYLCQHPNMHAAIRKEVNYITSTSRPTRIGYSNVLDGGGSKTEPFFTIDGSAQYFRAQGGVPETLQRLYPDSKIVVMLRNPVDRLYSNYHMNRRQWQRRNPTGTQYPDFKEFVNRSGWEQSSINDYANNLRRWYSVFPTGQILLVQFESFIADPQSIVNEVFAHLGLAAHAILDLRPVIPYAPTGAAPRDHYTTMDPDVRRTILKHFKQKNEHLFTLIGKKFEWV